MKVLNVKWNAKRVLIALALGLFVWMLYVQGSEQRAVQSNAEPASDTGSAPCRVEATVADLNVRSAPAENPANVVDQLAEGEEVDATTVVQDGFRKLTDGRWVFAEYVRAVDGTDCG
ncbi:SH3 domain-containing protein [Actinophytocola xanthii]|uniref:SH3b domain-containing protein n=1 Tax=Actinophytocola xanthii TaxID=1912961 RepID=A0A1Q8CGU3_9PSEU|nr:hypothetical protein [Actinophytocola xanthii]OLF13576.1 hypothetical protein BU204_26370 [Actinophytocola xanthii]